MPTAIDISSVAGLIAVGIFTAQILLGLLLSVGYIGLTTAFIHPLILLASATAGFRLFDILVPIWSPTQPFENTLGAIAFYLIAFVVLTSYFRRVFGRHRWKQLHYTSYGAAAIFFVHGTLADPLLQNRPVDFIDAEKAYVEGCALLVAAVTAWRFARRRRGDRQFPPISTSSSRGVR